MNRRLWACVPISITAVVSMAGGCQNRSAQPTFDPFVNRATIPPPPTGAAVGGVAPPFSTGVTGTPGIAAGAAGAYQPNGAPLNPAQPYGPPAAFGSPPTISAPAGQFAPPQIQAPGTAPYAPPGGYNYQNQYRQGAANDLRGTTSHADEPTGRRQIAARNNDYEGENSIAFAGNSASTSDDKAGVSQIRWAGEAETSTPGNQLGAVRTVSYETAVPAGNQGASTLQFVESDKSSSRQPAPASLATSSTRNAPLESQYVPDDGPRFQPMETPSVEQRPAEPRSAPAHSIVTNRTNEVAPPQTNVAAGSPAPVQIAAPSAPQSTARFAHDAQYQWLNGRLEYSQLDRRWKLRYIEIDGETDSFGGSVVLPDASALQGYQPGEFVTVRGSVDTSQTAPGSFAPAYRLQQIQRP